MSVWVGGGVTMMCMCGVLCVVLCGALCVVHYMWCTMRGALWVGAWGTMGGALWVGHYAVLGVSATVGFPPSRYSSS